jgi:hypothetical protein
MQVYGRIMNRICAQPMQWTKQACAPNHTIHLFRFTTPKLLLVKSIYIIHSPVQKCRDMESTSYYPKKLLQLKPLSVSGYEQCILLQRFHLQTKRALKQSDKCLILVSKCSLVIPNLKKEFLFSKCHGFSAQNYQTEVAQFRPLHHSLWVSRSYQQEISSPYRCLNRTADFTTTLRWANWIHFIPWRMH